MEKGINTIIFEQKNAIAQSINEAMQTGLPMIVIQMMLAEFLQEIDDQTKKILTKENEEYQKGLEIEKEQVKYEPVDSVEE